MSSLIYKSYIVEKILYRIEDVVRPSVKVPSDSLRGEARLPPEGSTISVEMALNSRCSSDYDGNPRKSHWGIFDRTKRLSEEQIGGIVDLARVPRLTTGTIAIRSDGNMLMFLIDNHATEVQKEWLMVDSGMQQQAVGLVCSALGVGTVIKNLGRDGLAISEHEYATVKMRLDAMKPSHGGSYWTDMAPAGRAPWLRGNLPDPVRDGKEPLISALASLEIRSEGSEALTEISMSQLLWAARGRTPHLCKTKPWGLTVPTWGGKQNISSVYAISDGKLSQYINWHNNRPTHSLWEIEEINEKRLHALSRSFLLNDKFIIIGKNEDHNRSLWEVGYQLFNVLVQAKALDIPYEAALLDETQKIVLRSMGIEDPIAIIML